MNAMLSETRKELFKCSVGLNMAEKAIDFLMLQDAMKMSLVKIGATEEEADEIICEVLQAVAEKYRSSDLKSKIKIETTLVPFPGRY